LGRANLRGKILSGMPRPTVIAQLEHPDFKEETLMRILASACIVAAGSPD